MTFHAADHAQLFAAPHLFDFASLEAEYEAWGRHLYRTSLALEMLAQLLRQRPKTGFRGGTLLQTRIRWPPLRASVDIDVVTDDAKDLYEALQIVVGLFPNSGITVSKRKSNVLGFKANVRFSHAPGAGYALRVDALETPRRPKYSETWTLPDPWANAPKVSVPTLETQAAQKLLLMSPAPFGRHVSGSDADRGRKSRIKDLFDLRCLARLQLNSGRIVEAAFDEVALKNEYLGREFQLPDLIEAGQKAALTLAPARPDAPQPAASYWRAHGQIRPTIQEPFPELDLRITAGCVHNALEGLDGSLDWDDSWKPLTTGTARRGRPAGAPYSPVPGGPGELRGGVAVQEAWSA